MNTDCRKHTRIVIHLCSSVFICGLLFPLSASAAEDSQALDSADFIQLRGGLANCEYAFEQRGEARVAFLGGSITRMTGWRDLVCEDLQARYPDTKFDFVQAGNPSMGSTPGAFRLTRDVFGRGPVDLLFVEAAVNDSTNHRTPIEQVRGMEGIIRHARTINPELDIVMLHFADPEKLDSYRHDEVPEVIQNHERVAEHYNVPSIDLAREVTARIGAGEFRWEDDFKDLHPSPFGHQVYLKSIQRLFELAWSGATANQPIGHELPIAQIDPYSYTNGRMVSIEEADSLNGFTIAERWRPSDRAGTRAGFVDVPMLAADTPGASFRYTFTGSAIGLWVAAGPDAGVIEYRIDGGPSRRIDLYTEWSGFLHLPWAYILDAELTDATHTVEVIVAQPDPDRAAGGNAIRIAHFLVNG